MNPCQYLTRKKAEVYLATILTLKICLHFCVTVIFLWHHLGNVCRPIPFVKLCLCVYGICLMQEKAIQFSVAF